MSKLDDRQLTQLQETGEVVIYLPIYIPELTSSLRTIELNEFDVKLDMQGGLVKVVVTDWKDHI